MRPVSWCRQLDAIRETRDSTRLGGTRAHICPSTLTLTGHVGRRQATSRDPASGHSTVSACLFVGLPAGWLVAVHVGVTAAARGPARSDEVEARTADHWIRTLCAPFLCSIDDSTSQRQPRDEANLPRPSLRCGGQSCG